MRVLKPGGKAFLSPLPDSQREVTKWILDKEGIPYEIQEISAEDALRSGDGGYTPGEKHQHRIILTKPK
jgi:hypothetical protein